MSEMTTWYCFKDKIPMVKADIMVSYLDVFNSVEGIKCPKCGMALLTEETVIEKVQKAEETLENK